MSDIFEEPPDENEQYENLDESLDEADLPGHGGGPEGSRELDVDVVADRTALEEIGANLDDPERISILDGGMDDPDGSGPVERPDGEGDDAGWDVDPVSSDQGHPRGQGSEIGADGDALSDDDLEDVPDIRNDPELELVDTDATEMDQVPDDAPGADSARW